MNLNAVTDRFLNGYCVPARIFLIIGIASLFVEFFLNVRVSGSCIVGSVAGRGGSRGGGDRMDCVFAASMWIVLLVQTLFIAGWTWLIQHLCGGGAANSNSNSNTTSPSQMGAWFLLLLPFLTSVFRVF